MAIKQIIIVEGKNDRLNVLKALDKKIDIYTTEGSKISKNKIIFLKEISYENELIVLVDPDFQGERIRKILDKNIPNLKHAFISRKKTLPSNNKNSVGIEHASKKDILKSLGNVLSKNTISNKDIFSQDFLLKYDLIGKDFSRKKRNQVSELLGIGETNGKQFLKRINSFSFTKEKLLDALSKVEEQKNFIK